jgi:hypothetical protein
VLPSAHFFKILTTPHSGILALDSNSVLHFSGSGFLRDSIPLPGNFRGTDMIVDKDHLYILANNMPASESIIIQVDLNDFSQNEIRFSGGFVQLTKNNSQSYFWASEKLGGNSSRLVKLSLEGHRLLELNSLSGEIDDIYINPHDNSIILVQRYQNNVVLYDSLGNQLTQGNKIYDPIKVFIY